MTTPDLTAPAPKRASLWEDFVDVLYAPRAVFERRRDGRFGAALLVYVAIATAIAAFTMPMMAPIFDRQLDRQIAQMREQGAGEQQIATARSMIQKMQGPVAGAIGGAVSSAGAVLLVGLLLWAVGKAIGSEATLPQSMMVSTYANVPRILGMILTGALLLFADPASLSSVAQLTYGPARFMSPDSDPVLLAFLQRIDLFTIWVTVLLGVGLAVVGKLSRGKALAAAACVYLIATVWAVMWALRQAAG
jgi:hypothetical protein